MFYFSIFFFFRIVISFMYNTTYIILYKIFRVNSLYLTLQNENF